MVFRGALPCIAQDRLLLLSRVLSQLPKAKVVLSSTWRRDEAKIQISW